MVRLFRVKHSWQQDPEDEGDLVFAENEEDAKAIWIIRWGKFNTDPKTNILNEDWLSKISIHEEYPMTRTEVEDGKKKGWY